METDFDKIKNKRSNKQHADKILEKINEISSGQAKRAMWELVQNARDIAIVSEGRAKVNITIELHDDSLIFSHDGKYFDYDTLYSLIIQVSSKDSTGNESEVGQFGTGFCTTHAFGRKIILNSSLQLPDNTYIPIRDFEINRQGDSDQLINQISDQIELLDKLVKDHSKRVAEPPYKITSFKYIFDNDDEREYAHIAIRYIKEYVKYVFTLNEAIESLEVKICMEEPETTERFKSYNARYKRCKEENLASIYQGLYGQSIIDESNILNSLDTLYIDCNQVEDSLKDPLLKNAKIVLPLSLNVYNNDTVFTGEKTPTDFARIFIYFPLIGSHETWGTSFAIHSPEFIPKTERNGVYLVSESVSTKKHKKQNRHIIDKTQNIIFDFLEKNARQITEAYHIAQLSFPEDKPLPPEDATDIQKDNIDYYRNQQTQWESIWTDLPIVRYTHDDVAPKTIQESHFFHPELFQNEEYKEDIYKIVSIFRENIPTSFGDEYYHWTKVLSKWKDENKVIQWITFEDIAETLSRHGKLDERIDEQTLVRFYTYLAEVEEGLFHEYALLPNLNNNFRKVNELKKNITIDPYLVSIANELDLATSEDIIRKEFIFDFDPEEYTGKLLNKTLTEKKEEIRSRYNEQKSRGETKIQLLSDTERKAFIRLCSIFHSNTPGIRKELMPHLCEFWEMTFTPRDLKGMGEENRITYDDTFLPLLVEDLLIELGSKDTQWNREHKRLILDIVKCAYRLASLTDLLNRYPAFLNQNDQLKTGDLLLYEKTEVTEELKMLYNQVFSKKNENEPEEGELYDINDFLLDKTFYEELSSLTDETKKVKLFFTQPDKGREDTILAHEIYFEFEQEKKEQETKSILTDTYKDQILDIIQRIAAEVNEEEKNKYWSPLFPAIEKEKAELFLESASDTKQGVIFNIMRQDDDTIESIASMIEHPEVLESLKDKRSIRLIQKLSHHPQELNYLLENINKISVIIRDAKEADNKRKEEQAHKEHIKAIGKHIQDEVLNELNGVEMSETSTIQDEQGGQDFIIKKDGKEVYYIEVKSRWNSSTSIRLSKRQSERAFQNPKKYAVITVDLSKRNDITNYYPEFDDFKPSIRVLTDVGSRIESIHSPDIAPEEILRINDYSSTIEQEQFEKGMSFSTFTDYLKKEILL